MVYRTQADLTLTLEDFEHLPHPGKVLMAEPTYFEVKYVINPHMVGNVGSVDSARARAQWEELSSVYKSLGFDVRVLEGQPGLPDMVFCANQTLPAVLEKDVCGIVPSRMRAPQRQGEVIHFERFFTKLGYELLNIPFSVPGNIEGMGDALWHRGRRLLWGGYGFRTDPGVYDYISRLLQTPIVCLHLSDPDFYHLDTCLSILNDRTALLFPDAFSEEARSLLAQLFETLIEAPEDEARNGFAVNAHCPDERHVIVHYQCHKTIGLLKAYGFEPVPVDTGEFLKAGGSVYCMKLMHW